MRIRKKLSKKELENRILELENKLHNAQASSSDSSINLLTHFLKAEKIDALIYDITKDVFENILPSNNLHIIKQIPLSLESFQSNLMLENDILKNAFIKTGEQKTFSYQTKYIFESVDNKESYPINLLILPIPDHKDKCIIIIKDYSIESKQQKEILRNREKIEESDKLKSIILSNISHYIRTPLNSVTGFAELLAGSVLEEEKRQEYIDIIKRQSKRILTLIDDLSEIAKLESGNINISKTPCSLNLILKELLLGINRHRAEKRKELVDIRSNLPTNSVEALTDSGRLLQALNHILNYSLRYTNEGKIELGYSLVDQKQKLEFYIHDTSDGLSKEEQKSIFSKFTTIDNTETTRLDDPGLGLTIAKSIIKALGGKIWVESEVGKGTRFIFNIPFEPVPSSDVIQEINEDEIKTVIQYDWPNKVILIVDDEEVNAMFLDAVFHGTNAQLIFAKNGQEAIDLCKSISKIDLILMDLKMPGTNGLKATKEIRKFNYKIPIIAQTALTSEEDKINCEKSGCNDMITKPIEVEELLKLVNHYIAD